MIMYLLTIIVVDDNGKECRLNWNEKVIIVLGNQKTTRKLLIKSSGSYLFMGVFNDVECI